MDYPLPTGTNTGGSTILSLALEWDAGTSGATWTTLLGVNPTSLSQTYTITNDITSGTTYKFRYKAQNIHGWGADSAEVSIIAAEVPQTMSAVTITNQDTNVRFSWTALSTNGAAISAYKLEIMQSDYTYSLETTYCDGTNSTVISNQYCDLPMSVLTSSPFSLTAGSTVYAQVAS